MFVTISLLKAFKGDADRSFQGVGLDLSLHKFSHGILMGYYGSIEQNTDLFMANSLLIFLFLSRPSLDFGLLEKIASFEPRDYI